MASNDSIAQVAGLLASILRYISHKPKMITPFSVTLSTIPTPIFKKQQTPANQAERRAYWIGVRVTSMGTAAHIYLGNQNAQLIDLTTVGDYHEFAVEGHMIDANEICAYNDVGTTGTILITGYEYQ